MPVEKVSNPANFWTCCCTAAVSGTAPPSAPAAAPAAAASKPSLLLALAIAAASCCTSRCSCCSRSSRARCLRCLLESFGFLPAPPATTAAAAVAAAASAGGGGGAGSVSGAAAAACCLPTGAVVQLRPPLPRIACLNQAFTLHCVSQSRPLPPAGASAAAAAAAAAAGPGARQTLGCCLQAARAARRALLRTGPTPGSAVNAVAVKRAKCACAAVLGGAATGAGSPGPLYAARTVLGMCVVWCAASAGKLPCCTCGPA